MAVVNKGPCFCCQQEFDCVRDTEGLREQLEDICLSVPSWDADFLGQGCGDAPPPSFLTCNAECSRLEGSTVPLEDCSDGGAGPIYATWDTGSFPYIIVPNDPFGRVGVLFQVSICPPNAPPVVRLRVIATTPREQTFFMLGEWVKDIPVPPVPALADIIRTHELTSTLDGVDLDTLPIEFGRICQPQGTVVISPN